MGNTRTSWYGSPSRRSTMPWKEVSAVSLRLEFVHLASQPGANQRGARGPGAIGAPSARVVLGRLRPRRAGLRFPGRVEDTRAGGGEQGHRTPELCLENA